MHPAYEFRPYGDIPYFSADIADVPLIHARSRCSSSVPVMVGYEQSLCVADPASKTLATQTVDTEEWENRQVSLSLEEGDRNVSNLSEFLCYFVYRGCATPLIHCANKLTKTQGPTSPVVERV